jgi:hypothetical protein
VKGNDMRMNKRKKETVSFPLSVFETADTKEDLEDWLLSQDSEFIKKMRKARQEDLLGKGKSWESLKREQRIKLHSCPPPKNHSKHLIHLHKEELPRKLIGSQDMLTK